MLKQRMYSLVIFQLSGIQKGIQAWHAGEQFCEDYHGIPELEVRKNDKTVIILNGGTTNQLGYDCHSREEMYEGTIDTHLKFIQSLDIPVSSFREPTLNNAITAIAFLADERVWDRKTYMNPDSSECPEFYTNAPNAMDKFAEFMKNKYGIPENISKLRYYMKDFQLA